jgi:hypothetical protein
MTMNLLKVSKEIKKINDTLDYLKTQNSDFLSHVNTNHDLITISDEIKNNMNEIHSKIDQIYNFNLNCKFDYENKNYNDIKDFLLELNIDIILINKIIFLNFNSLNEILLTDDEIFEKLDIPKNTINLIKNKIQEKVYVSNIDC